MFFQEGSAFFKRVVLFQRVVLFFLMRVVLFSGGHFFFSRG